MKMKKIKKIIKDKAKQTITDTRGENYIDVIIGIMVLMMVIVLTMNIYKVMIVKQDLDTITDQLITIASAEGCFGSSYERRVNELRAEFFDFETEERAPNGWYNDDPVGKKVNWSNTMQVKISVKVTLDGAGVFKIKTPVTVTRSGVSAKHWNAEVEDLSELYPDDTDDTDETDDFDDMDDVNDVDNNTGGGANDDFEF